MRSQEQLKKEYKAHKEVRELARMPISEWPNRFRKTERSKKKQTSRLKP